MDFIIENFKKLEEIILDLAVKGKLVPQNPEDEPASVLLEKIKIEKEKLIKEKKIKKDKEFEPISEEEKPFEIPDSWEWVRLGEISNYGNTISILPQNIDDNSWTLELEDIEKESSKIIKIIYNSERQVKSNKHCFEDGDVLYSKLRPYLKKILVAPQKGVCTSEIIPFRGYGKILSEYIVKVMKSNYIDIYVNSITHGMNMARLGTESARNICFPLPPLAEQKRIVEKVDKLIALCDDLEKKVEKSQKEFEKILESAVQGVVEG